MRKDLGNPSQATRRRERVDRPYPRQRKERLATVCSLWLFSFLGWQESSAKTCPKHKTICGTVTEWQRSGRLLGPPRRVRSSSPGSLPPLLLPLLSRERMRVRKTGEQNQRVDPVRRPPTRCSCERVGWSRRGTQGRCEDTEPRPTTAPECTALPLGKTNALSVMSFCLTKGAGCPFAPLPLPEPVAVPSLARARPGSSTQPRPPRTRTPKRRRGSPSLLPALPP